MQNSCGCPLSADLYWKAGTLLNTPLRGPSESEPMRKARTYVADSRPAWCAHTRRRLGVNGRAVHIFRQRSPNQARLPTEHICTPWKRSGPPRLHVLSRHPMRRHSFGYPSNRNPGKLAAAIPLPLTRRFIARDSDKRPSEPLLFSQSPAELPPQRPGATRTGLPAVRFRSVRERRQPPGPPAHLHCPFRRSASASGTTSVAARSRSPWLRRAHRALRHCSS